MVKAKERKMMVSSNDRMDIEAYKEKRRKTALKRKAHEADDSQTKHVGMAGFNRETEMVLIDSSADKLGRFHAPYLGGGL